MKPEAESRERTTESKGNPGARDSLPEGLRYLPGYLAAADQKALVAAARTIAKAAPLFRPSLPGSNRPFSVRMTNAGPYGWLSDRSGYRYSKTHPYSNRPWPEIPRLLLELWDEIAAYPAAPQCCLVNYYDTQARMGLHQDRDEEDLLAPVVSISLGDSALFRLGGPERKSPTRSWRLHSGDIVVLAGEARLSFHGIDRILGGSSGLLKEGGRLNLTLRRVFS